MAKDKLDKNNIIDPKFDLIKHLTEKEGFKIILQNMENDTTGLVLIRPKDNTDLKKICKLIAVNRKLKNQPNFQQRLRFIVAHEYGHSLIHYNGKTLFAHRSTSKKWKRNEKEADFFARCLLMPREQMEKILFEQLLLVDDKDYIIKHISQTFNVTEKKAKQRIKEINKSLTPIQKILKIKEITENV